MPDWSYQTIFRPLLFRLPAATSRDWTLHAMGGLSRIPGGSLLIRTLGHMELHPQLQSRVGNIPVPSPVGLSGGLDVHGVGLRALSQLGFGYAEIGPVTVRPILAPQPLRRDEPREAIVEPEVLVNDGVDEVAQQLSSERKLKIPLMIRIAPMSGTSREEALQEIQQLIEKLSPFAAGFFIDVMTSPRHFDEIAWLLEHIPRTIGQQQSSRPILIYMPTDLKNDYVVRLMPLIRSLNWTGIVLGDFIRTEEGAVIGPEAKERNMEMVQLIRQHIGTEPTLIATGGIHEPNDALQLIEAGASFVQLYSGFVYSGPGLPKRVNEAILYERIRSQPEPVPPSFWHHWGWICLLGLGMMIGGLLAWIIAATRVVLPYDEQFLGMDRSLMALAGDRILPFMAHDRITLAGTMISIGIVYFQLARHGLRRELHWARTALTASGIIGFASFFLYLGYGYFDPLHFAAAAALFPMFLFGMRHRKDLPSRQPPNRYNDRAWRQAQWGQLAFVVAGFGLAAGGLAIALIGINGVFVPTDLTYLCLTPDMLQQINERLIPLIAHDRAGFGGALFCDAIAILAIALWGINQGEKWVWNTLLVAGLPGFVAGLGVHYAIGYTDFIHLLPLYIVFLLYGIGLILLHPYMHLSAKSR